MKKNTLPNGKPKLSSNRSVNQVGDDAVIWDTETENFYLLNVSAFTILKACDGSNSIREIVSILSEDYVSIEEDQLMEDVQQILEALYDKGLVEFDGQS